MRKKIKIKLLSIYIAMLFANIAWAESDTLTISINAKMVNPHSANLELYIESTPEFEHFASELGQQVKVIAYLSPQSVDFSTNFLTFTLEDIMNGIFVTIYTNNLPSRDIIITTLVSILYNNAVIHESRKKIGFKYNSVSHSIINSLMLNKLQIEPPQTPDPPEERNYDEPVDVPGIRVDRTKE